MKIGFITTINTNIGDDFIRTGIEHLVHSIKASEHIDYTYVNKHVPETAITSNSPWQLLNKAPNFKGKYLLTQLYYRFLHARYNVYRNQHLIIQSGAPVLWPDCQDNEWAQPIWYNIIGRLHERIPTINLAAGSCYPWETKGKFGSEKEAQYAKDIGSFCRLTTTRDTLAQHLFNSVDVKNTLMPCTAFFVDPTFENKNQGKYILINYMAGGGHFDWGQHVDAAQWESTMKEVVNQLSAKHEVRFICHSDKEEALAKQVFPGHKTHYPKTITEYLECSRHALLGINNRMHASVAMGSVGVPAVSICTDTRLLMLENIGLPIFYVKEATTEALLASINKLLDNHSAERRRLFALKQEKFNEYRELIRPYIA